MSEKYPYWLAVEDGQTIRFADLPHMMAKAMHPASDMGYGAARVNLEEELPKAVQRGELVVRNALDMGHHTFPFGDALKRAVMLPHDLRPFLESRGIELRLNPHGSGPEFWTIENAALAIAEQEGWHDGARGTLLDQMVAAANAGELTVRDPHTGLHKKSGEVRQYWELLAPDDVNNWLASQGVKLRWEPRAEEGPTFPWPSVMHGHRVWRLRDALAEVARNAGSHADSLLDLAKKGIADRSLTARNLAAGGISVPGDDGLPELIDWFFSEDINGWLDATQAPFSYRLPTDAVGAESERTAAYQAELGVRVQRAFTRTPLASSLLAQLRDVPPDEPVIVHEAMGNFSGQSVSCARDFVEDLERVVARQENGFFTVSEAARLLVDANPGLNVKDLIERMSKAKVGSIEARRRLVRSADLMPLTEDDTFREYMDIVTVEEVDEWLARSMGVPYRLGPLVPHLSAFPGGKQLPTDVRYEVPLHDYLEPKTPWKGGRMAQDEALPLREAARLASRHAGQDITELDFLRAGARGEIHVRVIVPRAATMLPVRPSEGPVTLRKGALREIPPQVCEALSIIGTAHWRELESREPVEAMGGRVCRFVCWRLAPGEDDLVSTTSECVVMGWDVHALADAMLEHTIEAAPAAPSLPTVERPDASPPLTVVKEVQPTGPVFSMTRAALVTRHEHHWPTIQSDLKNASTNGLAQAKAGARDWNEALALEWARANNKLEEQAPASADPLAQAMRNLSALPGRKNVLKG